MALADRVIQSNPATDYGAVGSAQGEWKIVWDDAVTDATAAETYAPLSLTASVNPIKLGPNTTRILIRGRIPTAVSAVGTSPGVWVFGVWPDPSDPDDIDSGIIARIDNADQDASALAVTFQASPTSSNSITQTIDGVEYHYSDIVSLDGTDLKGAKWAMVVVPDGSLAAITGSGAVAIQALVID